MPTLESLEYERFSYDESALTLDEAVKKASDLRKKDSESFYRVEPAGDGFTVKKVSMSSVYAEFLARAVKLTRRFSRSK